jgi:hypothetical protein
VKNEAKWNERFAQLEKFKHQHGHCRVLRDDKENKHLAIWINMQRRLYSKGSLLSERVAKLENLGFAWDTFEAAWQQNFDDLKAFKIEHGHCRVPQDYAPNNQLGTWVGTQRQFRATGKLSPERIAKLQALGFEWKISRLKSTMPNQDL